MIVKEINLTDEDIKALERNNTLYVWMNHSEIGDPNGDQIKIKLVPFEEVKSIVEKRLATDKNMLIK